MRHAAVRAHARWIALALIDTFLSPAGLSLPDSSSDR
jgi:hypothetical protein